MEMRLSGSSDEEDTSSCSTSSTTTTHYVNRKAAYEFCNSPTSQFGTCYNFVRKTLQKFNISSPQLHQTSGINKFELPSPFSSISSSPASLSPASSSSLSKCCPSKGTACSSQSVSLDNMPIELKNIGKPLESHKQENVSNLNREKIKTKRQHGSFFSIIKEHILSKPTKNIEDKLKFSKPFKNIKPIGFLNQHRYSLPITYSNSTSRHPEVIQELIDSFTNMLPKKSPKTYNKVGQEEIKFDFETVETKETEEKKKQVNCLEKEDLFLNKKLSSKKRELWGKVMQKSFSSDSLESKYSKQSRQQSTGTETNTTTATTSTSTSTSESSARLAAYYSMPELRLLSWSSCDEEDVQTCLRVNRNKPKLSDLHPITFLKQNEDLRNILRNDSQDTQTAIEEIGSSVNLYVTVSNSQDKEEKLKSSTTQLKKKLQLPLAIKTSIDSDTTIELNEEKFLKSEKAMRSLSVEYKPQICESYREGLRRFSASPSLLVSKPFVQFISQANTHETYPSVGSEESFVTIIPANKSCHGSNTIESGNENEDDSFVDDVIIDFEQKSESLNEKEALCENISIGPESNVPTINSTTTTKSNKSCKTDQSNVESKVSTPSPPANLHRYFHLFKCGELEELIENHINNLCVIKSYYSEHATSWCVFAEKVQVWTI